MGYNQLSYTSALGAGVRRVVGQAPAGQPNGAAAAAGADSPSSGQCGEGRGGQWIRSRIIWTEAEPHQALQLGGRALISPLDDATGDDAPMGFSDEVTSNEGKLWNGCVEC